MTGPTTQDFDPFGDKYHERLTECLQAHGGADSAYYNQLKARWLIRLAGKHLGDTTGLNFLDLGCGTGLTGNIIGPGFRLGAGIDLSRGMLKARVCRLDNCTFFQASVTHLPFANASFDLVFSVTLIHHLPDKALVGMLKEVRRVLKPGGLMVHFDHNPKNFLTRKIVNECEYDRNAKLRPIETIADLAAREGFRAVDTGYIIFLPASLKFLEPVERLLKNIPLGGQYFLSSKLA